MSELTNIKPKEEIETLISRYKACDELKSKQLLHITIVEKCMPLVKKIACSINAQAMGLSHEDLIQVGSIGLIKAIDFYNPDKNTKFKTYVLYFIKGEIRHYLRDKGSLIKAPREMQELLFKASSAIKKLNEQGFQDPSKDQIAEELKISPEKLNNIINTDYIKSALSLDQNFSSDDEDLTLLDKIPSEDYQEFLRSYEDKIMLSEAIYKLPKDLRIIIELCFFADYNQREVSEKLGISQMQVSRKLKKALNKLYEIITSQNIEEDNSSTENKSKG
ncbi:MAG: sigma-70 family RNA polymerase sigma factor [Clostridiaceae bacterium]|jgi:RNA polymerase sigma-B factor|nr:sigma-70 family RNA polymerase sigma factor [Clostridiaceae bacterium]